MSDHHQPYLVAREILKQLERAGHAARLAGGCVRDRLRGATPQDYDIATTATPEQSQSVLQAKGFKVVPTGWDHGTVTAVKAGVGVEVTTLRVDKDTDGRHASVAYTDDFQADAARRDFTVNAMYEDYGGKIYDYFEGQEDLKHARLRFVGQPSDRVCEDYLRILRMFRFWSTLSLVPETKTIEMVSHHFDGLAGLSRERITAEIQKLLGGQEVMAALSAMAPCGLFAHLGWDPARIPPDVPPHLSPPEQSEVLFAYLASESEKSNWRLSTAHERRIAFAWTGWARLAELDVGRVATVLSFIDECERQCGDGKFLRFCVPLWRLLERGSKKHEADRRINDTIDRMMEVETRFGYRRKQKLPIDGDDLCQQHGWEPGPQVGEALDLLRAGFLDGDWSRREEGFLWLEGVLRKDSHKP